MKFLEKSYFCDSEICGNAKHGPVSTGQTPFFNFKHESSEEIKVCLKSLFKMDEDYCVRKLRRDTYDQFEWEAHVFFDDCMKKLEDKWKSKLKDKGNEHKDGKKGDKKKPDDTKWVVNDYVLDLLTTVDEYGTEWDEKIGVKFQKPQKMFR